MTRATPSERDCLECWQAYAYAYAALIAIDHPKAKYVGWPERVKAFLRARRQKKFDRLAAAYLHALQRATRNTERRAAKKAAQILTPPPPRPQLRRFEMAWPASFDWIADRFPNRPRVSNDLELGSTVRPRGEALGWRYIQHNQPTKAHILIIDYDAPDGVPVHEAWQRAGLKRPTWIAATPGTPRGHVAYALTTPVCTSDAARLQPLRYLASIEAAYRTALNGDRGYSGLLTKNPVHPDAWEVSWLEPQAYSLADLAAAVELPRLPWFKKKEVQPIEPVGLGRKVLTFDRARFWAYETIRHFWSRGVDAWHRAVREKVDEIGSSFEDPLPESHRRAIAKSIAKWTWRTLTPSRFATLVDATHTPAQQARRGRKKGEKTRDERMDAALAMLAAGSSLREVGAAFKVTHQTVANWRTRKQKEVAAAASPKALATDLHCRGVGV